MWRIMKLQLPERVSRSRLQNTASMRSMMRSGMSARHSVMPKILLCPGMRYSDGAG